MAPHSALADARRYEIMVIIHPDLGEDGIMKRLEALRKQITSFPGEIFHEELWGLRNLTYPLKKQDRGFYAVLDFVAEPEKIKELNQTLQLEPEVLRHMVTVLPPTYAPVNYFEEAEKQKQLEEAEGKAGKEKSSAEQAPRHSSPKKEEKSVTMTAAPKATAKKKEEAKENLEEVDKKLKKLIDNPDEMNF